MQTSDFDYPLPIELIAQRPMNRRDHSRLLVLQRLTSKVDHRRVGDLPRYLQRGDVLVLNDSKVMPARLRAINRNTGGKFEVLLLEEHATNDWQVMMRPGKRARCGTPITFADRKGVLTNVRATVVGKNDEGHRRLRFDGTPNLLDSLAQLGEVPLPPYIKRSPGDNLDRDFERYQTVYAQVSGSVAAPTAGLHFTERLLEKIREQGVHVCCVTLHVGLGTFAPVKTPTLAEHIMHEERFTIDAQTAHLVGAAKRKGHRVMAVGTTTVRVLESVAACHDGQLLASSGKTRLFIYPPYRFRVVDALLTNFHLPCSTLLMLVSAFAAPNELHGRAKVLAAYAEAIRQRYRFFSYGDAMLVL